MHSKRFQLKKIQPEDIKYIHQGLSNPIVTRYYAVHFDTLEDTKEQMEWFYQLETNQSGQWWGIWDKSGQQFYGAGGFSDLSKIHKKAEIGLWLLEEHWGNGILKEVMPLLFELGFIELGLNRIEGFVDSRNQACQSALAKVNFQLEGCMRSAEIENGTEVDILIYAILKRDWLQ